MLGALLHPDHSNAQHKDSIPCLSPGFRDMRPRYPFLGWQPCFHGEPRWKKQDCCDSCENQYAVPKANLREQTRKHDGQKDASEAGSAENEADGGGSFSEEPMCDARCTRIIDDASCDAEEEMCQNELIVLFTDLQIRVSPMIIARQSQLTCKAE